MKARFFAALVASAFLVPGAIAAVSGPAGTVFDNDAHLKAQLSNTSPNKIVIDGELITRVTGPDGAFTQQNTDDGALLITPLTGQNFTLFLETANGIGASIDVTPKPGDGKTLRLIPASAPVKANPDAKAWEESQPWEKTLVSVARTVVNGGVPENYTEGAASRGPTYSPAAGVLLTPERQLVGSHLRVMRYRMKNTGYVTRPLSDKQFWQKGVRAVMLSTHILYANGEGFVWVIFSTDAEGGA
ncbi:F-type conjugal transfer protein TraK [Acerihabitans sp. TG2]|uniref:F-type conjugal transfer protein TraK n=1 Tax=Acerihabitans sp. TG2 TaxID=3096008 RepID=UPI002B2363E6|nr:F-type conjugal transfer protein TraK [Acerihabitans sp. TG2]MEA9392687.1 F-type conjugal transfer protein TraK [Acerihabitans sp. TG2]